MILLFHLMLTRLFGYLVCLGPKGYNSGLSCGLTHNLSSMVTFQGARLLTETLRIA